MADRSRCQPGTVTGLPRGMRFGTCMDVCLVVGNKTLLIAFVFGFHCVFAAVKFYLLTFVSFFFAGDPLVRFMIGYKGILSTNRCRNSGIAVICSVKIQ